MDAGARALKTDRRGFLRLLGIGVASAVSATAVLAKGFGAPRKIDIRRAICPLPYKLDLGHTHTLAIPELSQHQHTFQKGTRLHFFGSEPPVGWQKVGEWPWEGQTLHGPGSIGEKL